MRCSKGGQFQTLKHRTRTIISRSWLQAPLEYKPYIFWKKLLKNKEMVLENGVKNIEAAAYKGARMVLKSWVLKKLLMAKIIQRTVLIMNGLYLMIFRVNKSLDFPIYLLGSVCFYANEGSVDISIFL